VAIDGDKLRGYVTVFDRLGESRTRGSIATPALVCDLGLLLENISQMSDLTHAAGVTLRPHVKSHKSAFIARRQLDAGAVGLSFAKLAEAEVVVEKLAEDDDARPVSVLLTSPLAGAASAQRAAHLARRCELIVVVVHVDGVDELALALAASGTVVSVVCDVDVGLGRTGVTSLESALEVVERIARSPRLHFAGVQGYGGHLQHLAGRDLRRKATIESTGRLDAVIDGLEAAGHLVSLRTGGGTGTSGIDLELGTLNELQAGSYVFMDREYRDALGTDEEGRFAQSLTIATTVISANQDGFVTVDAGLKSMATDAGPPAVLGHGDAVSYHFFGDEHGLVTNPPNGRFLRGDRLELVPPHCDPTVDRYDDIWLVEEDVVVGVIDVTARGCSQ
jgi:D-serine deaminase-like pyridoxal phosphate-dependent protein